jgi:hypothetical protein
MCMVFCLSGAGAAAVQQRLSEHFPCLQWGGGSMIETVVATVRTGSDGRAVIAGGLPTGLYWVVETIAPDGYELDLAPQEFMVPVAHAVVDVFDAVE